MFQFAASAQESRSFCHPAHMQSIYLKGYKNDTMINTQKASASVHPLKLQHIYNLIFKAVQAFTMK